MLHMEWPIPAIPVHACECAQSRMVHACPPFPAANQFVPGASRIPIPAANAMQCHAAPCSAQLSTDMDLGGMDQAIIEVPMSGERRRVAAEPH